MTEIERKETKQPQEQSLLTRPIHVYPSCWMSPIGESDDDEITDAVSPIPCNPSLRMKISHIDGNLYKDIPNVGRGTILIEDEFRIQWKADHERFFDTNGNELSLVQDSVKSRVLLCQADILSSCSALTIKDWHVTNLKSKGNVEQVDDYIEEGILSDRPGAPYKISSFKRNHLEGKKANDTHVMYFDDILKFSVPTAGVYSAAMHTVFNLIDVSGATTGRAGSILRVHSSINDNSGFLVYTNPIEIKSILRASVYVCMFTGMILIFFLTFIMMSLIRYRKSNIMKISQINFLYAFVFFGILSSATWIYPIYDDWHCRIIKFNVPTLCAMYAILIGRLWRINHVLSPLLPPSKSRIDGKARSSPLIFQFFEFISDWNACFDWLKCCGKKRAQHGLAIRRTVPNSILVRLVILISIPPLACQVHGVIAFASLGVDYDENHTSARYMCVGETEVSTCIALFYLVFLQCITVIVAYLTNGLPDQINETRNVLTASWTSFTFNTTIGIVILTLSPSRGTAPDLNYLLRMFGTNATVLNLVWHVIMPKIKMAKSGEDSDLKHLLVERRSSSTVPSDGTHVCRDFKANIARYRPSVYFSDLCKLKNNPASKTNASGAKRCHSWHEPGRRRETPRRSNRASNEIQSNIDKALDEISPNVLLDYEYDSDLSSNQVQNRRNSFVVSQDCMPPSRFMSQILSTLDILWKICSQVSTEEIPSSHDWHIFRARITDLSNQCKKARFDFDDSKGEQTEETLQLQSSYPSFDEESLTTTPAISKLDMGRREKDVAVKIPAADIKENSVLKVESIDSFIWP